MPVICRACAVERGEPVPKTCPICADERQYVPLPGQVWTDLDELRAAGTRIEVRDLGGYYGLRAVPTVGIGQTAILVPTKHGALLWDPPGYLDATAIEFVRSHGPIRWIAASHPHMFGVQLEWSAALDDAAVLVNSADAEWLGRRGPAIQFWSGECQLTEELRLLQLGGHFPGSCVAYWSAGQGGAGVLLGGDTLAPNPDRQTVAFMRSFPNRLPLSGAVVARIADAVAGLRFDTLWNNFGAAVTGGADALVQASARRYIAWVRGDYDELT